ncbi:MAG TPA: response regulator [Pyrinomonadaceae bacterium]
MPTILIAEDNEDLRGMLRQLLESQGYSVLEAADGHQASELAVRERPALVIMDLGLPGMDGLSAVAEIRRHVTAPETEILIVSAYDRLEYRTEAVAAGCGGFMTKPVDPGALLMTISLLLRREEGEAATPSQA